MPGQAATRRASQVAVLVADQALFMVGDGDGDGDGDGSGRGDGDGDGRTVLVEPLPAASGLLDVLAAAGTTVVLVVPPGLGRLDGLPGRDEVVVVAARRSPAATLKACAEAAGSLDGALVVAADRVFRAAAAAGGARPVPHPGLARSALAGDDLVFVRLRGPRTAVAEQAGFTPYRFDGVGDTAADVLGATTREGAVEAARRGLQVDVLDLDVTVEDPLLVWSDAGTPAGRVVTAGEGWTVYAMTAADIADDLPAHGAHGHFVALVPDPALLAPLPAARDAWRIDQVALSRWPPDRLELDVVERLRPVLPRCPGTAATFRSDVDRYSGGAALDGGGTVSSRHSAHPDNARVVQALLADLRGIGYCATTHAFTHGGRTLRNVVADLPGTGRWRRPKVLEALRQHLRVWPPDWSELELLLGPEVLEQTRSLAPTSSAARERLLELALLRPWQVWHPRLCPLPGVGAELVVLGCHLDSTAARDGGYDPATGAARGADDDASGMAAVLAAARQLWAGGRLRHTVRFCFFNAEESGLVGSQAYAAMLHATCAPVRAVVCADMVGFNSDANRVFEVHAGATSPAVRDASVPIAQTVASWAAALGALGPAQVYQGTNAGGGSDRLVYDGAIGRSDHASFQAQGYPAVVVSEDFFVNLPGEPSSDANPQYHRAADTVVDAAYGADIACAIAHAVQELAG